MKLLPKKKKKKFPENVIVFITGIHYYSEYSENNSPLYGNSLRKYNSYCVTIKPIPKAYMLCVLAIEEEE